MSFKTEGADISPLDGRGLAATKAQTAATRAAYVGGFAPAALNGGTDTTPVAGTVYFGPVWLDSNMTVTGVGFNIGSVGGTDDVIVSLYDKTGAKVANSILDDSVIVGDANTFQEVPFTAAYKALGPGLYYAGVSVNGTTCRLRLNVVNGARGGSLVGVFATLAAITPPTAKAAAPIAYLY